MGGIRFTWYLPPERPGWLESPWASEGKGWEAGQSLQGGELSRRRQPKDGDGCGGKRLVREQGESAMLDHCGGQTGGVWESLDVEVAQHLVGAPATDQPNDVGIDAGAE
jgi:hypothetical protein